MPTVIPQGYESALGLYETQKAIGLIKQIFLAKLCSALHLKRCLLYTSIQRGARGHIINDADFDIWNLTKLLCNSLQRAHVHHQQKSFAYPAVFQKASNGGQRIFNVSCQRHVDGLEHTAAEHMICHVCHGAGRGIPVRDDKCRACLLYTSRRADKAVRQAAYIK